ncbi:hypothetical protein KR222_003399 [Zaprionus bogoriensis]|nr:hypothetical protein KR222_003399 [Zaprionus bogoriensis]
MSLSQEEQLKDHQEADQSACKKNVESVSRFNRNLQNNEVLTLHYLGLPYVVLSRHPLLQLKMPLSTVNYQGGENWGIALQLIITCPPDYPLQLPHVELVEKRNVSAELELSLRSEIAMTLERHLGLYAIVPVVTQMQMLLNNQLRRLTLHH